MLISSFNELVILTFYFFETNSILSLRTNKYSVTINLEKLDFSFTDIPIHVTIAHLHEEFENIEMRSMAQWLTTQRMESVNKVQTGWSSLNSISWERHETTSPCSHGKIAKQLEPFTFVKTIHIGCLIGQVRNHFLLLVPCYKRRHPKFPGMGFIKTGNL